MTGRNKKMKKLISKFRGLFLKSTRLVISPGPHALANYKISSLTVDPFETKSGYITKGSNPYEAIGTYGAFSPGSIINPMYFAIWSLIEKQFGVSDVQLLIEGPGLNSVVVLANNPTVGLPYVIMIDYKTMKIEKFYFKENEQIIWVDGSNKRNFTVRRNYDTQYKELIVVVDP